MILSLRADKFLLVMSRKSLTDSIFLSISLNLEFKEASSWDIFSETFMSIFSSISVRSLSIREHIILSISFNNILIYLWSLCEKAFVDYNTRWIF